MSSAGPVWLLASQLHPVGGMERVVLRLYEALKSDGVDVRLCVIADSRPDAGLADEHLGSALTGLHKLRSLPRLRRWMCHHQPSTIIACGVWAAVPVLCLPRSRNSAIVVWEHSLAVGNIEANRGLRVLAVLARRLYSRSSRIVAVSDSLRAQLEADGYSNVTCIPNPVVEQFTAISSSHGSRGAAPVQLLTVGRLVPVKNQQLAIRCLKSLPDHYRLTIAGDGNDLDKLRALSVSSGVVDRVDFVGYCNEIDDVYPRMDVVVQPSFDETFGMALFEAASYGLPVVALRRGVMVDMVPRYVPGVLTGDDPVEFASGIQEVVATPPSADERVAARARRIADFGVSGVVSKWRELLTEL